MALARSSPAPRGRFLSSLETMADSLLEAAIGIGIAAASITSTLLLCGTKDKSQSVRPAAAKPATAAVPANPKDSKNKTPAKGNSKESVKKEGKGSTVQKNSETGKKKKSEAQAKSGAQTKTKTAGNEPPKGASKEKKDNTLKKITSKEKEKQSEKKPAAAKASKEKDKEGAPGDAKEPAKGGESKEPSKESKDPKDTKEAKDDKPEDKKDNVVKPEVVKHMGNIDELMKKNKQAIVKEIEDMKSLKDEDVKNTPSMAEKRVKIMEAKCTMFETNNVETLDEEEEEGDAEQGEAAAA